MSQRKRRDVFWYAAIFTIVAAVLAVATFFGLDAASDDQAAEETPRTTEDTYAADSPVDSSTTPTSEPTTSTSTTTAESPRTTTSRPPATTYIDESFRAADDFWMRFEPTVANATRYTRAAILWTCCEADPRASELNAGRRQARLLGTVAIPDDQESDYVFDLEILLDGVPAVTLAVSFGQSIPLDVDVTGALRVKFILTPRFEPPGGTSGEATLAIGDARFVAATSDKSAAKVED